LHLHSAHGPARLRRDHRAPRCRLPECSRMKKIVFAVAAVALVGGFVLASAWYRQARSSGLEAVARERAALFVRPHSPVRGAETARVDLVEFTDPACETCAAFAPILEQLLARHPGRVRLVVRFAPLHEGADEVAR